MADVERKLRVFRTMLIYAGIRNTPKPLPLPHLDPVDEFWHGHVTRHFSGDGRVMMKDRILQATSKLAEEIGWEFDHELASTTITVNDRTSFADLYTDWFVTVLHPRSVRVLV